MTSEERLGAVCLPGGSCRFLVWAPLAEQVAVHIISPVEKTVLLERDEKGYHRGVISDVASGNRYLYRLNDSLERPDPASRFQPEGVHGPSQVIEPDFPWQDRDWSGQPLEQYIIYEIHPGTFTAEGTFEAIAHKLDYLKKLGVTAVELMPVSQFPGERNWGYDGVFPFAAQNSYGGPLELRKLVNACHRQGLAVVMDVVYNHLGPEGNCLADYGPYFTDRYVTPWGAALNFDGPQSDEVRRYFIENALAWLDDFHIDALRVDAVHSIVDNTPLTFIEELAAAFRHRAADLGRQAYIIAESSADNSRLIREQAAGGYGFDAQWNDDFHHSVHSLLTGETSGYYQDYGRLGHLVKAFREGFVYSGQFSAYRQRKHGTSSKDIPASRFVVFGQNHDQIGNRAASERLGRQVDFETLKLVAGLVLLSPFVPLLFMGEEYGEMAPFNYFVSHSDPALVEAVRKGRAAEFAAFAWLGQPIDPQAEATFFDSKLDFNLLDSERNSVLFSFYQELINLRKTVSALFFLSKENLAVSGDEDTGVLWLHRWVARSEAFLVYNTGMKDVTVDIALPRGFWIKKLDSAEQHWLGKGSGLPGHIDSAGKVACSLKLRSFALFLKEN